MFIVKETLTQSIYSKNVESWIVKKVHVGEKKEKKETLNRSTIIKDFKPDFTAFKIHIPSELGYMYFIENTNYFIENKERKAIKEQKGYSLDQLQRAALPSSFMGTLGVSFKSPKQAQS